jgi:hypothetical protein
VTTSTSRAGLRACPYIMLLAAGCATTTTAPVAVAPPPVVVSAPVVAAPPGTDPGSASEVVAPLAVTVEGKAVDGAGLVDVRALELACLADAKALVDTKGVRARFDDVAGKQLVPVGELAFILLERDPARSMTDPPPLLCRTIASSTVLHAPLVRTREPAARWLVKRIEGGLVVDAAALVQQSAAQKLALSARPRVMIDEHGSFVAVAVPVGPLGSP